MARITKLRIELVPEPLWRKNLRSKDGLGKGRWTKLRREVLAKAPPTCAICGGPFEPYKPQGHEVWKYVERPGRCSAKLLRVEIICRRCHDIHHWGMTKILIMFGSITHAGHMGLRKHFRKVNRCTAADFEKHETAAFREWRRRSKRRWKIDWGEFAPALAIAKEARRVWRVQQAARDALAAARKIA